MKNKIRIIVCIYIFICTSFSSNAQTDFFVDDSTLWVVSYEDVNFGIPGLPTDIYGYYINGDTVINAIAYKIIKKVSYVNTYPNWYPGLTVSGISDFGFVREDSGRVYFYSPATQVIYCNPGVENLLYDYSLQVGDSTYFCLDANPSSFLTVTAIDSMTGNLTYHLNNGTWYEKDRGGFTGPFEGLTVQLSGVVTGTMKYCKGDLYSCSNLAGLQELSGINVSIYPNPASGTLHIALPPSMQKDAYVSFYDASGDFLLSNKWTEEINIRKLEKGFYILKITSAYGSSVKRFVVE